MIVHRNPCSPHKRAKFATSPFYAKVYNFILSNDAYNKKLN
jgi:hypothetical protein